LPCGSVAVAGCPSARDTCPLASVSEASPLRHVLPGLPAFLRWRFAIQMGHEGNPHALTCIPASLRAHGGCPMDFYAILDEVIAVLRQRQRVTYRALKVQFQLDDDALEALKAERIYAKKLAADDENRRLVS